MAKIAVKSAC